MKTLINSERFEDTVANFNRAWKVTLLQRSKTLQGFALNNAKYLIKAFSWPFSKYNEIHSG